MKLPFLQKLTGLGGAPVGRVVGSEPAAAALRHLLGQLPELLLATVLEAETGAVAAAFASAREYQPAAVAGPATAVVRQLHGALAAQALAPDELQEVVLTLGTQLHVLRPASGGRRLLYLAADTRDTNLAILRQLATEAASLLDTN